jgi:hypothetical protein
MKSEKTWVENVSDISYNAEDLFDNEVSYLEYSYIYKKKPVGKPRYHPLSLSYSLGRLNRAP